MLEALKEWSLMLVVTSFIGGISAFVVSESNQSMKKYVKFACSVVALAVMIAPIKGLLQELPSLFQSGEVKSHEYYRGTDKTNEWILTKSIGDLKSGISNAIYQKFSIKTNNVYIYIKQDSIDSANNVGIINKSLEIEKIRIVISHNEVDKMAANEGVMKANEEVADEIKKYLTELLECEIIIDMLDF